MTTVLVTGFEPFAGRGVNSSWDAVEALSVRWGGPERLVTERLPVSFRRARQQLRTAIAEHAPDLVLCVGEAAGRSRVGLERVAVNLIDARIPDADGSAPVDVPVIAGAPVGFLSTLPVKACLGALEAEGIPAEVSGTAGTYVCNATFYALQHLLDARHPGVRGGFVHVPALGAPARPASRRPGRRRSTRTTSAGRWRRCSAPRSARARTSAARPAPSPDAPDAARPPGRYLPPTRPPVYVERVIPPSDLTAGPRDHYGSGACCPITRAQTSESPAGEAVPCPSPRSRVRRSRSARRSRRRA